jgi:hypothetical protein
MIQSRLACRNISNSGAHNLTHPSEIAKAILQAVTSGYETSVLIDFDSSISLLVIVSK